MASHSNLLNKPCGSYHSQLPKTPLTRPNTIWLPLHYIQTVSGLIVRHLRPYNFKVTLQPTEFLRATLVPNTSACSSAQIWRQGFTRNSSEVARSLNQYCYHYTGNGGLSSSSSLPVECLIQAQHPIPTHMFRYFVISNG